MRDLQNGRSNVYKANSVGNFPRGRSSGKFEDQWYVNRFIIKKNAVMSFSVFPKRFTVIGHYGQQRIVEQASRLQSGNELSHH
jgi:hypothetical protein